jgi:hypothetical protein
MRLRLGNTSPKKVKTPARTTPLSIAEKAQSVIKDAIEHMPTGRWYCVPTSAIKAERPDTVCQGFGMKFDAIAPVFICASILAIRKKKDGTTELFYKKKGFEMLLSKYANLGGLRIEEARLSEDNRARHYFILRGKPKKGGELPTYATCGAEIPHLPIPKKGLGPASLEKVKRICEDVSTNIDGIQAILELSSSAAAAPKSFSIVTDYSSDEEGVEVEIQTPTTFSPLNNKSRPMVVTPILDNEGIEAALSPNVVTPTSDVDSGCFDVMLSNVQRQIDNAMYLDFDKRTHLQRQNEGQRPPRCTGQTPVKLVERASPDGKMWTTMILLAKHWGYDTAANRDEQNMIAMAAIRTVAYDCGLKKMPKGSMWKQWLKQFEAAVEGQENGMAILLDNKKMGPKHGTYTERIEAAHPGYLHDVYRCTLKAVSVEATWSEIALAMNEDSTRINDKPNLEMSR